MLSKYLRNLKGIKLYKLEKDGFNYEIYITEKIDNSDIITSILIYPDPRISFYVFSIKLKMNKIRNRKGQRLNLLDLFNNKKVLINEINDSEIMLIFETNEVFTNINLLEFGKGEKYIYSITIKKNEYYVLWRDPNFGTMNVFEKHISERISFCIKEANMNIFGIKTIEEALKFFVKRKRVNDKIIFITNIGLDYSGRRFIEIVRNIYKNDIMVLFYSKNKDHIKWVKNFQNCLITNRPEIYQDYILNYNEIGLKKLKDKIEKNYNLIFKPFTNNFLYVPEENFFIQKINPYIRHVKIFSISQKGYLYMLKTEKEEGKVVVRKEFSDDCLWDVTILNQTITFYSNDFYIEEKNGNAIGYEFMVVWNFKYEIVNNEVHYWFEYPKTNKVLSIEEEGVKINKINNYENDFFILEDVTEKEDNRNILFQSISSSSDLSKRIRDDISSKKIDE